MDLVSNTNSPPILRANLSALCLMTSNDLWSRVFCSDMIVSPFGGKLFARALRSFLGFNSKKF